MSSKFDNLETRLVHVGNANANNSWSNLSLAIPILLPLAIVAVIIVKKISSLPYVTGLWPSIAQQSRLLNWLSGRIPYVSNIPQKISQYWKDGSLLCTLINTVVPGACPNPQRHWKQPPVHAQALAYKYLGVTPVLSSLDFEEKELSPSKERIFINYLFKLQETVNKLTTDPNTVKYTDNYIARGMGLIVGEQNRISTFYIYPNADSMKLANIHINVKGPYSSYGQEVISVSTMCRNIRRLAKMQKKAGKERSNLAYRGQAQSYFFRSLSFDLGPLIDLWVKSNNTGDIQVKLEMEKDRAKISFLPKHSGMYEILITSNGEHLRGSPFVVRASKTNSIISKIEGIEQHVIKNKVGKRIISKSIDFIDESVDITEDNLIFINLDQNNNKNVEGISTNFAETEMIKSIELLHDAVEISDGFSNTSTSASVNEEFEQNSQIESVLNGNKQSYECLTREELVDNMRNTEMETNDRDKCLLENDENKFLEGMNHLKEESTKSFESLTTSEILLSTSKGSSTNNAEELPIDNNASINDSSSMVLNNEPTSLDSPIVQHKEAITQATSTIDIRSSSTLQDKNSTIPETSTLSVGSSKETHERTAVTEISSASEITEMIDSLTAPKKDKATITPETLTISVGLSTPQNKDATTITEILPESVNSKLKTSEVSKNVQTRPETEEEEVQFGKFFRHSDTILTEPLENDVFSDEEKEFERLYNEFIQENTLFETLDKANVSNPEGVEDIRENPKNYNSGCGENQERIVDYTSESRDRIESLKTVNFETEKLPEKVEADENEHKLEFPKEIEQKTSNMKNTPILDDSYFFDEPVKEPKLACLEELKKANLVKEANVLNENNTHDYFQLLSTEEFKSSFKRQIGEGNSFVEDDVSIPISSITMEDFTTEAIENDDLGRHSTEDINNLAFDDKDIRKYEKVENVFKEDAPDHFSQASHEFQDLRGDVSVQTEEDSGFISVESFDEDLWTSSGRPIGDIRKIFEKKSRNQLVKLEKSKSLDTKFSDLKRIHKKFNFERTVSGGKHPSASPILKNIAPEATPIHSKLDSDYPQSDTQLSPNDESKTNDDLQSVNVFKIRQKFENIQEVATKTRSNQTKTPRKLNNRSFSITQSLPNLTAVRKTEEKFLDTSDSANEFVIQFREKKQFWNRLVENASVVSLHSIANSDDYQQSSRNTLETTKNSINSFSTQSLNIYNRNNGNKKHNHQGKVSKNNLVESKENLCSNGNENTSTKGVFDRIRVFEKDFDSEKCVTLLKKAKQKSLRSMSSFNSIRSAEGSWDIHDGVPDHQTEENLYFADEMRQRFEHARHYFRSIEQINFENTGGKLQRRFSFESESKINTDVPQRSSSMRTLNVTDRFSLDNLYRDVIFNKMRNGSLKGSPNKDAVVETLASISSTESGLERDFNDDDDMDMRFFNVSKLAKKRKSVKSLFEVNY